MSTTYTGPPNSIIEIVGELKEHLSSIGYSVSAIARMNSVWKKLITYCEEREIFEFTADVGRRFVWEQYGAVLGDKDASHNVNRAVHMLVDFVQFGMVYKQSSLKLKGFSPEFRDLFEGFLQTFRDEDRAEASIMTWRSRIFRFEYFLIQSGVENFSQIQLSHVNAYLESLIGFSAGYISATIRTLGKLFDYAAENGYHDRNFADSLPHIRKRKSYRIPTTFTPDEVDRILATVDRANPIGKRNYAILILVAKLGLRIGDVRALRLDNIDWQNKQIRIVQHKTGKPLELPLLEDIGWAIIDYLRHGRPETSCERVFVRHTAPFNELSNGLNQLVHKVVTAAGIHIDPEKPIGMHSFRHSIASSMLQNGADLTEIAQILGHASPESTQTYVSLDMERLRQCALEVLL